MILHCHLAFIPSYWLILSITLLVKMLFQIIRFISFLFHFLFLHFLNLFRFEIIAFHWISLLHISLWFTLWNQKKKTKTWTSRNCMSNEIIHRISLKLLFDLWIIKITSWINSNEFLCGAKGRCQMCHLTISFLLLLLFICSFCNCIHKWWRSCLIQWENYLFFFFFLLSV